MLNKLINYFKNYNSPRFKKIQVLIKNYFCSRLLIKKTMLKIYLNSYDKTYLFKNFETNRFLEGFFFSYINYLFDKYEI